MQRHPGLAAAAYLVGATLILIPLLDAAASVSPPFPGDFRWRFGAAGLLANALLIPNLGVLLLLVTAIGYGHSTFRRVVGVFAFIGVALCVTGIVMFALDALQTRPAVRPEMNASFAVASASAIAKMVLGAVTLFVLGLVGVRKTSGREGGSVQVPGLLFAEKPTTR